MARYRLSEAAAADIDVLWLYVAEHGSVDTADRLIDAIMDGIRLLADHPGMGRARDELAPGLRSLPHGGVSRLSDFLPLRPRCYGDCPGAAWRPGPSQPLHAVKHFDHLCFRRGP